MLWGCPHQELMWWRLHMPEEGNFRMPLASWEGCTGQGKHHRNHIMFCNLSPDALLPILFWPELNANLIFKCLLFSVSSTVLDVGFLWGGTSHGITRTWLTYFLLLILGGLFTWQSNSWLLQESKNGANQFLGLLSSMLSNKSRNKSILFCYVAVTLIL